MHVDEVDHAIRPRARRGSTSRPVLLVASLSLGNIGFAALLSLVTPALHDIAVGMGVSTADVSWVLTAQLAAAAVLTPILGRIADLVGKRTVLLAALALMAAGTAVAALAPSFPLLIAGRAIQGAGGSVVPLSMAILRDELPREKAGMGVGILSAAYGLGGGVALLAAGPITAALTWKGLFWLPLAMIVLAFGGVIGALPARPRSAPGRLDLPGALILSASLVSLMLVVSEGATWGWGNPLTILLASAAAASLAVFTVVELRSQHPLVDLRLMRDRRVWVPNAAAVAFGFAMFGGFLLIPLLLGLPAVNGHGFGLSTGAIGLMLLPNTLAILAAAPIAGLMDHKLGPKAPMVIGAALAAVAFALPAMAPGPVWPIIAAVTVSGLGIGLAMTALPNAILASTPLAKTGEALSVNNNLRTIGGSIGASAIAAVLAANTADGGIPPLPGFTLGFWLCSLMALAALAIALLLPTGLAARVEASIR